MGLGGLVESRRGRCGMSEWGGVVVSQAGFENAGVPAAGQMRSL